MSKSMNAVVFLMVSITSAVTVRGHHPFFPRSAAPSPSPSPNAQVEAQFHSLSQSQPLPQSQSQYYPKPQDQQPSLQQYPFFPSSPTPPPPPSTSVLVTFPANISALLLPHVRSSPSSSSTRKRLFISLTISLSLLFSAILVAFSAYLIYSRNRTTGASKTCTAKVVNKTSSRVRLFPPNTLPSDSPPPKILHRPGVPSSTSSEFLYLGTLATPNTPYFHPNLSTLATNVPSSASSRATGSPDLRPLPPLPKLSGGTSSKSGEALIRATEQLHFTEQPRLNEKDEDEDFYSPRESPRVLVGQKLVDLLEVRDLAQGESMLIRISADAAARRDVLDIAAIFRANAVDVSDHSVTLQLSGTFDKMVALQRLLEPYGACEVLRTGETA